MGACRPWCKILINMSIMRRLYKYMIVALVALMPMGCVSDNGDTRSTKQLGLGIWHEVDNDLNYVNGILRNVVHLDYLMGIEDEAERADYIAAYLPTLQHSNSQGRYLLTTNTQYNTRYTTTFETGDNRLSDGGTWHISCPSGLIFDLEITPKEGADGRYIATFNKLQIFESSGSARLEVSFKTDKEYNSQGLNGAIIDYSGEMVMVDPEASIERPLTLTTTIQYFEYHEFIGCVSGAMEIVCHDEIYGTKDRVGVDIDYNPRRVIITCWGEQHKIFL